MVKDKKKNKYNFLVSSGWFSDINNKTQLSKQFSEHIKKGKYGGFQSRTPKFSEYWLSSILNQSIQPKKICILDANSPDKMSAYVYKNSLVEVSYQIRNFGHGTIASKENILCGWARGVLHGAMQAYLNDMDFVYIEQDLLLFGKDFLKNIFIKMDKEKKKMCYMNGTDTPQKIQQSLILVKHDYLHIYISDLLSDTNHTQTEEDKHFNIVNNEYLLYSPYRGGRQRKDLNPNFFCLQHLSDNEISYYLKKGQIINNFNKSEIDNLREKEGFVNNLNVGNMKILIFYSLIVFILIYLFIYVIYKYFKFI
jgi:hypothetical protein